MKRSFKNLIRLISLALAMLLLSSCTGCDIVDFFDSLIPVGTDENGDPIIPGDEIEGDIEETGAGYVKKIDDKKYADWKDKISAVENTTEQEILGKYKYHVLPSLLGQNDSQDPKLDMQIHGVIGKAYVVYAMPYAYGNVYWEKIGGLEFRYTDHKPMFYKNNEFISLADAWDQGLIDKDDLAKIHKSYVEENYSRYYKRSSTLTASDSFDLKYIRICIQPGYNNKAYTKEDFSDVGATMLEGKESYLEKEQNKIGRYLRITVNAPSKLDMIHLIRTLESRDDVFYAEPEFQ